ncbi:DUF4257 domain-containing protein [Metabacillus arenae]|uniref:DUF4257 domain-containing protein n=1 Tax=Metabacillus arenae TaxID=2771434 RepID=A0A926ND23_9BACI|nr:DUF4257 domain-containing protein [Metabacillus arenae]MBD1379299.1 DUF4257 domain-containing protein [Metabacillus arenae]
MVSFSNLLLPLVLGLLFGICQHIQHYQILKMPKQNEEGLELGAFKDIILCITASVITVAIINPQTLQQTVLLIVFSCYGSEGLIKMKELWMKK